MYQILIVKSCEDCVLINEVNGRRINKIRYNPMFMSGIECARQYLTSKQDFTIIKEEYSNNSIYMIVKDIDRD